MPDTLLRTKLFIPPLRPNLVRRPQLIARLNLGLEAGQNLTLICAPAGFGKTTLAREWVDTLDADAKAGRPAPNKVAWLSLDEGDDDPARFLTYLVGAINQIEEIGDGVGKAARAMMQSPQPPPAEEVLTSLINDLADIPGRLILILDDYHVIDAPPVDAALTFLLEHLPPQLHLVVATRVDPDLHLGRLRARGQLNELRAADLRFTAAEAAAFLNDVMGLNLSPADVAALEARTEGWVAGLQLAAISMRGRADAAAFVQSFTGSHHFVLDYLVEDVLEQQPAAVQAFLLQTAVLDRLTGPLCDALTGRDDGQATLAALERANLFIVRLDEERRWYRYHHLFADLLRRRLRQGEAEAAQALHRRASAWYEANGFADEAIEHALRAEDFARAATLLERHIDTSWGRRENRILQRWLDRLPEATLFSRPNLSVIQARLLCNRGQLDKAERTLQAVERALASGRETAPALSGAERSRLEGRAAVAHAHICSYRGDVAGIIRHANQALAKLPPDDLTWRSVAALTLGNAYGFQGDMAAAYEARREGLRACEAAGDVYFIVVANLEVAITLREQGHLHQTVAICREQRQFADACGLSQSRAVGWLLAVWGETLAELGDLDGAVARAREGFQLAERSGDLQMLGWSFLCLLRVLLSCGEFAAAEEIVRAMERIGREATLPPWIARQVAAWQARLWLAQDNLEDAAQWARDRGLDNGAGQPPTDIGFFLLFDYMVLARILLAQGRLAETTRLLDPLLAAAEAGGRTSSVIAILLLQALALYAGGETARALPPLGRALSLAEPEGFTGLFVDEGRPMARLLYQAAAHEMAPDYTRQLLAAFPLNRPERITPAAPPPAGDDLVEPLSEREVEVLQLVAAGLTNREIASRLYLSLNTVKVHTRNIYGKLGVHNRTQAVTRARALGILLSS